MNQYSSVSRRCLWLQAKDKDKGSDVYYLHNHLRFNILINRDAVTDLSRIVGFEVEPFSVKHSYSGEQPAAGRVPMRPECGSVCFSRGSCFPCFDCSGVLLCAPQESVGGPHFFTWHTKVVFWWYVCLFV